MNADQVLEQIELAQRSNSAEFAPADVLDLPLQIMKEDVLRAYRMSYDPDIHTAYAKGVDYLVYCRVHRTPDFLKMLQKFVPQMTNDMLPPPPTVYRLNVPIKVLDIIEGESHVPLITEDR